MPGRGGQSGQALVLLPREGPAADHRRRPDPGQTRADTDPSNGEPVVLIQLEKRGQLAFLRVTAAEAKRGKKLWIRAGRLDAATHFQHFAIAIDGRIVSAPSIDFQQYPNGISAANGTQITGLHGTPDAKGLALLLKSGTLPVRFTVQR